MQHKLKSIAFPVISTGIHAYPIEEATKIAVKTVNDFLNTHSAIDRVIFVCFDDNIYQVYQQRKDLK